MAGSSLLGNTVVTHLSRIRDSASPVICGVHFRTALQLKVMLQAFSWSCVAAGSSVADIYYAICLSNPKSGTQVTSARWRLDIPPW